MAPNPYDLLLAFAVIVAFPIWDHFRGWPAMRAKLESGDPGARTATFVTIMLEEWAVAAIVAALWLLNHRPAAALGLVVPGGWKLVLGVALVLLVGGLLLAQVRVIRRLAPERRARAAARIGSVGLMLPRTTAERRAFAALSVTAGICEELVYRGFLLWALRPWLGAWGAAAASLAGFTLAHAYQGRGFVQRTGGVGLLMTLFVMGTGSIVTAAVLHAVIDVLSGEAGYALVREEAAAGA